MTLKHIVGFNKTAFIYAVIFLTGVWSGSILSEYCNGTRFKLRDYVIMIISIFVYSSLFGISFGQNSHTGEE